MLGVYPYAAPLVLAPLSFWLWRREYPTDARLIAGAWLIPILWAYIVPGIGTNILKVWEFDTRLKLGRFRPHHGFVFGSATATLAWCVHTPVHGLADAVRFAFIVCSVLGFWNLLYDVKALRARLLAVYNQAWADGKDEAAIALDYAPWFFGGFGAVYGLGVGILEWLDDQGPVSNATFALAWSGCMLLCLTVPVAGFAVQSRRKHGHWGVRPVTKR